MACRRIRTGNMWCIGVNMVIGKCIGVNRAVGCDKFIGVIRGSGKCIGVNRVSGSVLM